MKAKTRVKAGKAKGRPVNTNETLLRDSGAGLKMKTRIKAGTRRPNHNETLLRDSR
jgi:hypothetical protein